MNNLPPGVSISDSDAPWNQDHPEPNFACEQCTWVGLEAPVKMECPDCEHEVVRV